MKNKIIIICIALLLPIAPLQLFAQDAEFIEAHRWMAEKNMTRFSTIEEYRPYDLVTREQAAKFYATFSKEILFTVLDMWKYCSFDDLDQADATLKNSILESCLLNLFQWSAWRFYPQKMLTKAQALAVFVRAIDWYRNESWSVRWEEYYNQSYERWLTRVTDKTTMDVPVTRYEMALLLYRAEAIAKKIKQEREMKDAIIDTSTDNVPTQW